MHNRSVTDLSLGILSLSYPSPSRRARAVQTGLSVATKMIWKKALLLGCSTGILCIIAGYTAFQVSPWPSTLIWRRGWDRGGIATARALEKYVPAGVAAQLNEQYDPTDSDARLDVFSPAFVQETGGMLPTVLWMHGGSWISGSKDHVANYLRILASKGFTTVGVNYTLAPAQTYPTPVLQANAALAYIEKNASRLHVDSSKFFLAGDSAGAQIAAQLANAISVPSYAKDVGITPSISRSQLRGAVLHCGTYEVQLANFSRTGVLWAYFGTKDFMKDPRIQQFSVARSITKEFPPVFLSSGNADALAPQSHLFASIAAKQGVVVDRLFFPPDHKPLVFHEFQFDLGSEAGRVALDRSVQFMVDQLRNGE
jgi:acetyl esterase